MKHQPFFIHVNILNDDTATNTHEARMIIWCFALKKFVIVIILCRINYLFIIFFSSFFGGIKRLLSRLDERKIERNLFVYSIYLHMNWFWWKKLTESLEIINKKSIWGLCASKGIGRNHRAPAPSHTRISVNLILLFTSHLIFFLFCL